MPAKITREPVMIVDIEGRDYNEFMKWLKLLIEMLKIKGIPFKRMPKKRENGVYKVRIYVNASGYHGIAFRELMYELLSNKSKGVYLNGKYYKWPKELKIKFRLKEEKTKQITVKRLERESAKPKAEEMPVYGVSHGERISLFARSTSREKLEKFIKDVIKLLRDSGGIISNVTEYLCTGPREVIRVMKSYKMSVKFTLKPGAIANITVYLPVGKEGKFIAVKEPYKIEFEDLLDKYKYLKQAIAKYPKIKEYAIRGISIHRLKNIDPEAYRILVETNMAAWQYDEYVKTYKAFSKETILRIRVVPEKPGPVESGVVKILLDGKPIEEYGLMAGNEPEESEKEYRIPVSESVHFVKIFDENGNPIVHTLTVQTSKYRMKEITTEQEYMGVVWIIGDLRVRNQVMEFEKINPSKVKVVMGFSYPNLVGCEKIPVSFS